MKSLSLFIHAGVTPLLSQVPFRPLGQSHRRWRRRFTLMRLARRRPPTPARSRPATSAGVGNPSATSFGNSAAGTTGNGLVRAPAVALTAASGASARVRRRQ